MSNQNVDISRRRFLLSGATTAVALGLGQRIASAAWAAAQKQPVQTRPDGYVDVGPASDYAATRVYEQFKDQGFFLISTKDQPITALSSYCTHKHCKVRAQSDGTFRCPCHGSRFDAQGHVTHGPARADLPVLSVKEDEQHHLLVQVSAEPSPRA